MSDKIKNIVVTFSFVSVLIIVLICNLFKSDIEISIIERRKMAQFPEITTKNLLNGNFSKEFDKYSTDQIVQRENFRRLKSVVELNLFRKKDNNSIYLYNGSLIKIEYPLNEESVLNAANKINKIKNKYLSQMNNCYYSIVPDKNYFTNRNEYIGIDYEKLQKIMIENVKNMEYINIFNCLELEDYYISDIHWKQESLQKVTDKIANQMNFKNRINTPFNYKYITDLEGVYARQLPVETEKDRVCILTNNIIENAISYNYEYKKTSEIYNLEKIESNDKYDIYLSGATPLIEIINSNSTSSKELVVFRDSFASSLVPLFTEAYSKIILVDIRYMRSDTVKNYIEFKNQDILFLYSTTVLNNSSILR